MPNDKALHFGAGFVVCAITVLLVLIARSFFSISVSMLPAILVPIIAGVVKEIRDWATGRGTPELAEFVATLCGGWIASILALAAFGWT